MPSNEKLVSIFESHTDIIKKAQRETVYGHKMCLSVGKSGLLFDCTVERGNPSDSTLAVQMMERHKKKYGMVPRQASYDGGFASKKNLEAIKGMGVQDVVFSKGRGLKVAGMAKEIWRVDRGNFTPGPSQNRT